MRDDSWRIVKDGNGLRVLIMIQVKKIIFKMLSRRTHETNTISEVRNFLSVIE